MKILCAALCRDLDPRPAGTGKQSRVRILVDFHLLNGGSRHSRAVRFDSIHHQCDTIRARGTVIEKARHRGDVVLIEHRDSV